MKTKVYPPPIELTPVCKYTIAVTDGKENFRLYDRGCHKIQDYFLKREWTSAILLSLIELTSVYFSLHLQYMNMPD
jgi:hypothetical protein